MRIRFPLIFGVCLFVVAAGQATAQGTNRTNDPTGRSNSGFGYTDKRAQADETHSPKAADRRSVAPTDEKFLTDAAMLNNAEIAIGQLVLQRSANSNVKSFAESTLNSAARSNEELTGIAERLGLTMPAALAPNHQAVIAGMKDMSGDDFDRAYVKQELGDYAVTIDMYKTANKSKEKQLKTFAKDRISALEEKYTTLKSLDNRLTPAMLVVAAPGP